MRQAALEEARRRGWEGLCLFRFEESRHLYRSTYHLARANQLARTENRLVKLLVVLGNLVDENGQQNVDGALLPPYRQVLPFLAPAGTLVHADPEGWFILGFVLKEQKPESDR